MPFVLGLGIVGQQFYPFVDSVSMEQLQAVESNLVGEHPSAGCRLLDRLENSRQQRLDFVVAQIPVDRAEIAPCTRTHILQACADRSDQQLAIDTLKRLADQSVARAEQREAEITMQHAPGISCRIGASREQREQLGNGDPGRFPDPTECL